MATIGHKSGKGNVWYIRFKGKSKTGNTIQKYKSTCTTDRKEAQHQLDLFNDLQDVEQRAAKLGYRIIPIDVTTIVTTAKTKIDDHFTEHRNQPITEHVEAWAESRLGEVSPQQVGETRKRMLRIVKESGMKTLGDFDEARIKEFCRNLKKRTSSKNYDPKKAKPASIQTRNMYRMTAKTFDKWLFKKKRQPHKVLQDMRSLKYDDDGNKPVPSRQRPPLDMAEIRKLWATTYKSKIVIEGYNGPTRYWLYLVAAETGLRKRELASLTPESFRLEGLIPHVFVPAAITKNGEEAKPELADYVVPEFRKWLADKSVGIPVFPKLTNKKTGSMMKQDLEEAGLPYKVGKNGYRDFHCWRHLFITNAWTSGESPDVIRGMARHSDLQTTLGYSHSSDRRRHDAVNKKVQLPIIASAFE